MRIEQAPPVVLFAAALALVGCASDALAPPEPDIETPGAFVAVDEGGDALTLTRTLDSVVTENDTTLVLTVYDVAPATWDEAREIAKQPEIPILWAASPASRNKFPSGPYQVVWFRMLTDEEKDRLR